MSSRTSGAESAGQHISVRTSCGREIRIGHLALGGGPHPAWRVSLGISASPDIQDGTWAGLTVDEARQLAAALLAQAAACDHGHIAFIFWRYTVVRIPRSQPQKAAKTGCSFSSFRTIKFRPDHLLTRSESNPIML